MKDNIFGLFLKKEFMAKILKIEEPEKIKEAFAEEGVNVTEEDVFLIVKNLKMMSSDLEKYSPEEIKKLEKIAKEMDPNVLEDIAGGGDPAKPANSDAAKQQIEDIVVKGQMINMAGNAALGVFNAVKQFFERKQDIKNAKVSEPKLVSKDQIGKQGVVGKDVYLASGAVLGVSLLSIVALYRKEIMDWFRKKK